MCGQWNKEYVHLKFLGFSQVFMDGKVRNTLANMFANQFCGYATRPLKIFPRDYLSLILTTWITKKGRLTTTCFPVVMFDTRGEEWSSSARTEEGTDKRAVPAPPPPPPPPPAALGATAPSMAINSASEGSRSSPYLGNKIFPDSRDLDNLLHNATTFIECWNKGGKFSRRVKSYYIHSWSSCNENVKILVFKIENIST